MINIDGIPDEFKKLKQWVCCDKDKVPRIAGSWKKASSTDSLTWRTFEETVEAFNKGGYSGIGFVFTKDDPYCFIDLDDCLDSETGEIDELASSIIQSLNGFTEISQSGEGIHVFVKAQLPDHKAKTDHARGVEIYDSGRYCFMTGNLLNGYPRAIEARQEQVNQICQHIFGKIDTNRETPSITSDRNDIENLKNIPIIDVVNRLGGLNLGGRLQGNCPTGHDSDGGKCFSLNVKKNYFHCFNCGIGGDTIRLVETVQGYNFIEAITWLGEQFNIPIQTNKTSNAGDTVATEPEQTEDSKKDDPSRFFEGKKFIPARLANDLMERYDFIYCGGELYIYQNGVYKPYGVDFIKQECYKILSEGARINYVNEVVANIQYTNLIDTSKINIQKHLINFENGMFDYAKGELLSHSKDYLSTVRIPVKYDPKVESDGAITGWLESTLIDADSIQLACELFGYCLIPDTAMAKAFMLVGAGANGKSTFLTVLENFIGQDNVSKVPLQELSDHRFKRAELFGKLVNLFADLDNRALESTTYFKTVVTGDSIDAERKNQNPFSFRPFARLVFSANEIPRSRDRSFAYYRRWCIIPFDKQFMGADDKKGLADELSKPENLSALLNCALPELKRIIDRQSFSEPAKVKEALNEYEKQNDPVKAFVSECCQFDSVARVERGSLYDKFCQYCDEAGFKTVTNRSFYQQMRVFQQVKELQQDDGKRVFVGIKLK